eukprot:6207945-Pleurochrysis_carterae.AAC.1
MGCVAQRTGSAARANERRVGHVAADGGEGAAEEAERASLLSRNAAVVKECGRTSLRSADARAVL